jgi:hypothetical protein
MTLLTGNELGTSMILGSLFAGSIKRLFYGMHPVVYVLDYIFTGQLTQQLLNYITK